MICRPAAADELAGALSLAGAECVVFVEPGADAPAAVAVVQRRDPDTWALIAAGRSAGGDVPPTRLLQGVVERARGAGATRLVAARAGAHAPERGELLRYGFVDECGELTLEL